MRNWSVTSFFLFFSAMVAPFIVYDPFAGWNHEFLVYTYLVSSMIGIFGYFMKKYSDDQASKS